MPIIYTATATAHGGRDGGTATSSDGKLNVKLSMPKEFTGKDGPGTNPEQLFAAGYAACFETILRKIAADKKTPLTDASVTGHVNVHPKAGGGFEFSASLEAKLDGVPHEEALKMVEMAHAMCPYSNATRGNMDVSVSVV